jgi:pimeloyl-ACP methyl ester carboxylesterase
VELPEINYAREGGVYLAYQVFGHGAVDLVHVAEFWHSIEAQWMEPRAAAFLERLGSFARVASFDQRGTGLSDPIALSEAHTMERWMDDVHTVIGAAGFVRPALFGTGGGGLMAMLYAASFPDRVRALVLYNSGARVTRAPDYPFGSDERWEADFMARVREGWGRGAFVDVVAPSQVGDAAFRAWWARYERLGSTPGAVHVLRPMLRGTDLRDVLPAIRVPTLVLHRTESRLFDVGQGRHLAENIPGARFVELPGGDHLPFLGDADAVLEEIEEFLTGARHDREPDRVLATVLFTDIVGSTEWAASLGDRAWKDLLARHHERVREALGRFRGREIDTAGDGFLATFDGPGRAIHAARAIGEAVGELGLEIRAGLHTGEVELSGARIGGIAVHIGARVAASAAPGEVLVSSTVRDLVAGSGIGFEDRGAHELKGVPGEWRLFAVTG